MSNVKRIEIRIPENDAELLENIGGPASVKFYLELACWLRFHPLVDRTLNTSTIKSIKKELKSGAFTSIRPKISTSVHEYWRAIHCSERWIVLLSVTEQAIRYRDSILSVDDDHAIQKPAVKASTKARPQADPEEPMGESAYTEHPEDESNPDGEQEAYPEADNEDMDNEKLSDLVPKGLFQS